MNSPSRTAPRGEGNWVPDTASRTDVMMIPGWMSVVQASSNTPQPDNATSAAIGAVFLRMSEHYYVCAGRPSVKTTAEKHLMYASCANAPRSSDQGVRCGSYRVREFRALLVVFHVWSWSASMPVIATPRSRFPLLVSKSVIDSREALTTGLRPLTISAPTPIA